MDLSNIKLEKKNQIAYVTINRPKVLNALNMATMQELWQVFSELKDDKQIRVVILTGGGEKAFVAGADINELAKNDPVVAKAYTHKGQATLDLIENLGKPVIGCINGFALGGGCEIAMACTMRLASESAKLGQPEVKLGIIPGYGGTQRLPRLVGTGLAMQILLTGEMITAQEAHRIGLVNEVVAADRLIPRAEEIAQKIIGMAPLAIQYCMEAVNQGWRSALPISRASSMHPDWEPDKLATAAIFYNLHEADIAKGLLDSCGVDCFLCDEHMHRVHPLTSEIIGGVRLQVAQQDFELAKELLKEYTPPEDPSGPGPIE